MFTQQKNIKIVDVLLIKVDWRRHVQTLTSTITCDNSSIL